MRNKWDVFVVVSKAKNVRLLVLEKVFKVDNGEEEILQKLNIVDTSINYSVDVIEYDYMGRRNPSEVILLSYVC
jgi:hypothetical protein